MEGVVSRKRKHCDFSEVPITVVVGAGAEEKRFVLHPSMLSTTSKYFKAAFYGQWKESNTGQVKLTLISPDTFQRYACWIYTGDLDLLSDGEKSENTTSTNTCFNALVKLYCLADQLEDMTFRNFIMDKFIDIRRTTRHLPEADTIKLAFECVLFGMPLTNLILDDFLAGTDPNWLHKEFLNLPVDFINSLTLGWAKASWDAKVVYTRAVDAPKCKYHEHDRDVPQTKTCAVEVKDDVDEAVVATPKAPGKRRR